MSLIRIRNGVCVVGELLTTMDLVLVQENGTSRIELEPQGHAATTFDATGLLVLPGLVDIHGDAFERQIMPRPAVTFALGLALAETDRQLAANGITTAFHGLTWSWEPGFRGAESARAFLTALENFRPRALVDHRLHLRQEVYNLDAEDEIAEWIEGRRIDLLAFNDHLTGTIKVRHRADKMRDMIRRSGLGESDFMQLVDRLASREHDVTSSIERLAKAALRADVPMMSHDDLTSADRERFRTLGARIAEFPVHESVAAAAIAAGDVTVFGAPNVLRGGSHTGCPSAADMVQKGQCSILASDYYYPSLLHAPFVLEERYGIPLPHAWGLVSRAPAMAAGFNDRGVIAEGMRGDVILVDRRGPLDVRVVCAISNGRVVYLTDTDRLHRS
jgi:alpha-D-ribose 1-methylphosphonate 5-triphosphate diphosphatase